MFKRLFWMSIYALFAKNPVSAQETAFYQDDQTGIKIIWGDVSNKVFPSSWQTYPINGNAVPISVVEQKRFLPILLKAMRKYPDAVLQHNLRNIYLCSELSFYGVKYGGTNSNDCLYLCNNGIKNGYTDLYLEQIFHHEFSSILYRNYPRHFDVTEWMKYTKYNFKTGNTGAEAIRDGNSKTEFDEELCQKGLLYQYAMSTMENDINSFAENLFAPTRDFWKLVTQYPNIEHKLYALIDFYHKINPKFTYDYFYNLITKK